MSTAQQALGVARAAGVLVQLDGDDLVLEASAAPPADVLDLLSRHKFSIVTLLRPNRDSWLAEDWHAFFHERAGIAEYDGGLPRTEAEAHAFECCVIEWLNRNPAPSPAGRCKWCGRSESCDAVVLPFGTEPGTHAWLHAGCWAAWHQARRAEAVAVLAQVGIGYTATQVFERFRSEG